MRLVLFLAAFVAVLSLFPSSRLSAEASGGRVRVIHASPDTPPVDVFVDGQKAVSALAFPQATPYLSLPAGPHDVSVFVSPSDGTGTPALQATLTIETGRDYTVVATGRLGDGSLSLLPLTDATNPPAAGKAHVRFIHASPDAPPVDIAVRGTSVKLVSNVPFRGVSPYTPVDAGTYDLDVLVAGTSNVALALDGVRLDAGTVYTVVAVGLVGDRTLRALTLVDRTGERPAPAAPRTGTGLAGESSASSAPWVALSAAGAIVTLVVTASALTIARRRAHAESTR